MGYLDEYKSRIGKCEFCEFHNVTGSMMCAECYGSAFKDKLDLYEFIRRSVKDNATANFNNTDKGRSLLDALDKCRDALYEAEHVYESEKHLYIESELNRIDDIINTL